MEKFFKWLYYYCLTLFILIILYIFVAMLFSPRKDALKRGFIPCTEKLVMQLSKCQRGSIGCSLGNLWDDTKCNISVVFDGFGAWVRGVQKTPWENYFFTPVAADNSEENLQQGQLLQNSEKLRENYDKLQLQRIRDEKLRESEMHLNHNVIIPDYEEEQQIDNLHELPEDTNADVEKGNIEDEAFVYESSDFKDGASGGVKYHQPDVVLNLQKITAEKIGKGE